MSLPPEFEKAVRDRKLLLFIGAGFSKNVDPTIPNWNEVIDEAAVLLDFDKEILKLQGDPDRLEKVIVEIVHNPPADEDSGQEAGSTLSVTP